MWCALRNKKTQDRISQQEALMYTHMDLLKACGLIWTYGRELSERTFGARLPDNYLVMGKKK